MGRRRGRWRTVRVRDAESLTRDDLEAGFRRVADSELGQAIQAVVSYGRRQAEIGREERSTG